MSHFAQKRDLSDSKTISDFAALVQTPERLRLLTVLTVADMRGVNTQVWNGWKGQLLRELYTATLNHMDGARQADTVDAPQAAPQLDVAAKPAPSSSTTEIQVSAPDRPGLFARMTHTIAMLGGDVKAARIRTYSGVAVDSFWLQDASGKPYGADDPRALRHMVESLKIASLADTPLPPIAPARLSARQRATPVRTRVGFDDTASETAVVVEVEGRDRIGLLADVARVFADLNLSLHSAHIDNIGPKAIDAFYISGVQGKASVDAQIRETLTRRLTQVLEARKDVS